MVFSREMKVFFSIFISYIDALTTAAHELSGPVQAR